MKSKLKPFKGVGHGFSYCFAIDGRGMLRDVEKDINGSLRYGEVSVSAADAIKLVDEYDKWLASDRKHEAAFSEHQKSLLELRKAEEKIAPLREDQLIKLAALQEVQAERSKFCWETKDGVEMSYRNGVVKAGCNYVPIELARKLAKLLKRKKR